MAGNSAKNLSFGNREVFAARERSRDVELVLRISKVKSDGPQVVNHQNFLMISEKYNVEGLELFSDGFHLKDFPYTHEGEHRARDDFRFDAVQGFESFFQVAKCLVISGW